MQQVLHNYAHVFHNKQTIILYIIHTCILKLTNTPWIYHKKKMCHLNINYLYLLMYHKIVHQNHPGNLLQDYNIFFRQYIGHFYSAIRQFRNRGELWSNENNIYNVWKW